MSILIELKQCEPWPAWSLGGQLMNSDEVSWRTLERRGRGREEVEGLGVSKVERAREREKLVNDENDS